MGVQPLAVGTLPRDESLELLCRPKLKPNQSAESCSLYHDPAADQLCELLDDLPLALHLAGCYLAHYGHEVSPSEYLEELRAAPLKHDSLRRAAGDVPSPTGHEQNVEATFQVSYDRLKPDDPTDALARRLFVLAGHCAPGAPIPRDLLRRALTKGKKRHFVSALRGLLRQFLPKRMAEETHRFADALRRLANLGLFQPAGNGDYQVHRLLAGFARDVGAEEEAEAASALAKAVGRMAYEANQSGLPARMLPLLPHLRQAAVAADARGDQRTAWLYNELGYHLDTVADYAGARPYYERALAIHEKVLGGEHPDTANSLNNLGGLLQAMGDLAGARPYYERALAIREKVLGGEHPDTATTLNDLGNLLQQQGDYAEARIYRERALAVYEQVFGEQHPWVATAVNNLGALLQAMGDLAGARPYYERALAIHEKVLGGEHPDTATSLNNLGTLLQAMGDLDGARPYYERALAIREKVLGGEHPHTANSLNNLGGLLQAMGDLAGARPYLKRALAIFEKVLGPDHPYTVTVRGNLASLDG
jgi:tetratricopeptide (TPR) repeat protein